jgi:hypothetical protein
MFRFLSSVFAAKREQGSGPDKELIERAIERVVDGTNVRIRGLGNYRRRLRESVEKAVVHVIDMVDAFHPPAEISRRAYGTDPRLRAFFVSASHLQGVIGDSRGIRDFLHDAAGPLPDEIFGLLAMKWKEKNVLGIELRNDMLQRDVPQVTVSFFDHRYLGPTGSEMDTRHEVKIRIFDYLVEQALQRMVAARSRRVELEQQRRLLRRKLDAMRAGHWGLQPMLGETETTNADHAALESEIGAIEAQLLELHTGPGALQACCKDIDETLGRAVDWINRRDIHLALDPMLIKVDAPTTRPYNQLELTELFSCSGERRIILPGRFPRREFPEQTDLLEQARRYL